MEQVETFKHLRLKIYRNRKKIAEINNRLESLPKLYNSLKNRFICKNGDFKEDKDNSIQITSLHSLANDGSWPQD